ncbi:hypothetical protein [Nonomuraea solani]|nr:hypothetical protein [Nonomuraea solani]
MRWSGIVALVLLLTACGGTAIHKSQASPVRRPVTQWSHVGGLMAPGLVAVRPPLLVLYADGLAIADTTHELRLPPAEVEALVKALDRDLTGQPATATPKPGSRRVLDAPITILGVDSGTGMREVYVPHLENTPDSYAPALIDARDRLSRLADRVTGTGRKYTTDRVRLYAEHLTTAQAEVKPWPQGVPLPPETQPRSGRKNYKGNKARTIARLIPRDGRWNIYRTSSGELIALAWHYLLPHE